VDRAYIVRVQEAKIDEERSEVEVRHVNSYDDHLADGQR
jgi:hypothetical protein